MRARLEIAHVSHCVQRAHVQKHSANLRKHIEVVYTRVEVSLQQQCCPQHLLNHPLCAKSNESPGRLQLPSLRLPRHCRAVLCWPLRQTMSGRRHAKQSVLWVGHWPSGQRARRRRKLRHQRQFFQGSYWFNERINEVVIRTGEVLLYFKSSSLLLLATFRMRARRILFSTTTRFTRLGVICGVWKTKEYGRIKMNFD